MGEVITLRRPKRSTIRGAAREALTQAMRSCPEPIAAIIVVLGADGQYSLRSTNDLDAISDFDMYSRGTAVLQQSATRLLE